MARRTRRIAIEEIIKPSERGDIFNKDDIDAIITQELTDRGGPYRETLKRIQEGTYRRPASMPII
jgi:hypothetical protein